MMLASPLLPTPTFSSQRGSDDYRPARDLEAFKQLLPPPIEFVEGSSSGSFAVPENRYEPINTTTPPKPPKVEKHESSEPSTSAHNKSVLTSSNFQAKSLYTGGINLTWPETCNIACGLYNSGNTCFLNSALQCLLHTPPLLRVLVEHRRETCRSDKTFCMTCSLREVAVKAHFSKTAFSPSPITNKLQTIAKHMRRGRQEDTHEFLRYAVDALQKSCLAGYSPKIDPKLAETTWVHKIFGGRLRSRVTCRDCGYNSDTFDRVLDLSLDIFKSDTLKDALKKFVAIDFLKGVDRYKCEKCRKHVVAEKRFTLHEAPMVLTIHLKRFSPLGRKIGHHVDYDERLSLQPFMSEGQYGPSYSLYGVICHAGGGPNSGHYYAFVKARDGQWWEMNDELVQPLTNPPVNKKTAYMLFYIRNKGQGLEAAMKSQLNGVREQHKPRLADGMKGIKRKERDAETDDAEDKGEAILQPYIGPLLPSPTINGDSKRSRTDDSDPQATLIKSKIQAAAQKARRELTHLSKYKSDDEQSEGEDKQEGTEGLNGDAKGEEKGVNSSLEKDEDIPPSSPPSQVPPSSSPAIEASSNAIPPSSFYSEPPKKRKSPDHWADNITLKRTNHGKLSYGNPYGAIATYASRNKRRPPRGI